MRVIVDSFDLVDLIQEIAIDARLRERKTEISGGDNESKSNDKFSHFESL